jgi:hypothetical protein
MISRKTTHGTSMDFLGCGRHVAEGHVVEHALWEWRDRHGHRCAPGEEERACNTDDRHRAVTTTDAVVIIELMSRKESRATYEEWHC